MTMETKERKKLGKKSRAQGAQFEIRVRKDLEEKGWIVDKWSNNVEFGYWDGCPREFIPVKWKDLTLKNGKHYSGPVARLIKAKAKWAGPGRPMMMGSGFCDFIAFRMVELKVGECFGMEIKTRPYEIIGVESKMTGKLDAEEKAKCFWLLRNRVFSKILIASKYKEKNKIVVVYTEFK